MAFYEALAEKVPCFQEQAGKSKPLIVFFKGGKEIARMNECNGARALAPPTMAPAESQRPSARLRLHFREMPH